MVVVDARQELLHYWFTVGPDGEDVVYESQPYPKYCKTVIPYGQALRLRKTCSEEENLQKRAEELKGYLEDRGHPEKHLGAEIQRALNVLREGSLTQQVCDKTDRIPLVITYNPTQ